MQIIDIEKARQEDMVPKNGTLVKDNVISDYDINEIQQDNDNLIVSLTLFIVLTLLISFIIFRIKKTRDKLKEEKDKRNNKK